MMLKQVPFSAGDVSLLLNVKQASKDSSKGNTGRETQQSCKELTIVSPPVIVVSHDNVTSSETKTEDEVKLTTFCHSKDGDINCKNNNNYNNNNKYRREDRGSLSLISSNGSVDEISLRLPFGIGLDCSPCGKRAASSSEFVMSHIQSVTQEGALDGSELNEMNEGTNKLNLESDAANTSRNNEYDSLIRKEFSLRDTDCVTVFNSTDAAQGISAVDKRRVPLKSIIDDNVQTEENNRKANEDIGKGNSAQSYDEHKFPIVVKVIYIPFILRILC